MGRGEMHLSILIETMRREGYELQVSPPHVLTHEENGKVMEPMERVVVDVPETYQGNVMTALGARKAILMNMQMMNSRSRIEFRMPSRGLFGYRSQFLVTASPVSKLMRERLFIICMFIRMARPVRLSQPVPDRHPRRGHHEHDLRRLRGMVRRHPDPLHRLPHQL